MTTSAPADSTRRLVAEFVGTAFLMASVVGSGIMATNLTDDVGLQLLCNTAATAGALVALILALGPTSGAHFNPVVTLVDAALGGITPRLAAGYVVVQIAGASFGVMVANLMFELAAIDPSTKVRTGGNLWLGEVVATLGLILMIFGVVRSGRGSAAPFVVAGYIAAAYFFTSSTSFANPAAAIGRSLSDSFAGIAPKSVPMFIVAEIVGGLLALALIRYLFANAAEVAKDVLVPHGDADRKETT